MSIEDWKARQRARKALTCRHFTGIQHDGCDAGIRYDDVSRPLPCLPRSDGTLPSGCTSYAVRTADELAADEAELMALIARIGERARAGECLHCGVKVERRVQVGRCVYAEPCGHRQGQGRA